MKAATSYNVNVILLCGGQGTRMGTDTPKQYLMLGAKEIARYSFDCFLMMPEVAEIAVVCHPSYRHIFKDATPDVKVRFAMPGERRQDSVYSGLQALENAADLVCVHDAARPFITSGLVRDVLTTAYEYGAAASGMPAKATVKEVDEEHYVVRTPNRDHIWEVHTPQAAWPELLSEGFKAAMESNLSVTDDVSLVELIGKSVKMVEGSYNNIKITTPEDLSIAEKILEDSHEYFSSGTHHLEALSK